MRSKTKKTGNLSDSGRALRERAQKRLRSSNRSLALDLIVDTMRSVSILHLLLANSATLAFSRGNDRSNFFKQFRGVDHYQSKFLTYSCNTLIEEIWV